MDYLDRIVKLEKSIEELKNNNVELINYMNHLLNHYRSNNDYTYVDSKFSYDHSIKTYSHDRATSFKVVVKDDIFHIRHYDSWFRDIIQADDIHLKNTSGKAYSITATPDCKLVILQIDDNNKLYIDSYSINISKGKCYLENTHEEHQLVYYDKPILSLCLVENMFETMIAITSGENTVHRLYKTKFL